jgi:hypothetical protein
MHEIHVPGAIRDNYCQSISADILNIEATAQTLASWFVVAFMSISLKYIWFLSGTSQYHVDMSQVRLVISQQRCSI